jgi:hypothetical protein
VDLDILEVSQRFDVPVGREQVVLPQGVLDQINLKLNLSCVSLWDYNSITEFAENVAVIRLPDGLVIDFLLVEDEVLMVICNH